MAPWQAGIDVVVALADYTYVRIGPAAETLVMQMAGLARKLARIETEIGPETLASAVIVAGQLLAITSVWGPSIDALALLGAYVPTVIGPTAQIIVDQIRGLANKFRQLQSDLADLGNLVAFTAQVEQFVQRIMGVVQQMNALAQGLGEPIDLYASGYTSGYDWVRGIVNGINNRLPDLQAVMAYIRGLFPSSPAKWGPWRKLPDGKPVGAMFSRALATGVSSQAAEVAKAMSVLRRGMMDPFEPAFGYAASAGSAYGPVLASASTGSAYGPGYGSGGGGHPTRPPVYVTLSNNTFGSRGDIDYLLEELERKLTLQGVWRL